MPTQFVNVSVLNPGNSAYADEPQERSSTIREDTRTSDRPVTFDALTKSASGQSEISPATPRPSVNAETDITRSSADASSTSAASQASRHAGSTTAQSSGETSSARFDAGYLQNPRPVYPSVSRRFGEEGRVVLRVLVSSSGLPVAIETKQSSGYERLDDAARSAVEKWRFIPARRGSQPIEAWVLVPLSFNLDSV